MDYVLFLFGINSLPNPVVDLSANPASICFLTTAQKLLAAPTGGVWTGNGVTSVATSPLNDNFDAPTLNAVWSTLDRDLFTDIQPLAAIQTNKLKIRAAGNDVWQNNNEFTAVTRSDITGDFDVSVKIETQSNTDQWAKTGIIVANNLTANNRKGYVFVGITPSNGVVVQWDSDNNGFVDQNVNIIGISAPVYVRLVKINGNTFNAYYGNNGTTWTQISGEIIPSSTNINSQIGLFASSHNQGTIGEVIFDDFKSDKMSADYYFNPTQATEGENVLTYSVTDANGCSSTQDKSIFNAPNHIADVVLDPNKAVCSYEAPFQISATPIGGFWTGQGVNPSGVFTPSPATTGYKTLTYTRTNVCETKTGAITLEVNDGPTVNREWVSEYRINFYTYNSSIDFDLDNNLYILSTGGGSRYFGCSLNTYANTKIGTGGSQKWQYIQNPDNVSMGCGGNSYRSNTSYVGTQIITDNNNGVYVLGRRDAPSSTTNTLLKLDPSGIESWNIDLNQLPCGYNSEMVVDANGDLYITCKNGGIVTKVSKTGIVLWTNSDVQNPSIKTDFEGNLYVAGSTNIPSNIVNKYNSNGVLLNGNTYNQIPLIDVDNLGNLYTSINETGYLNITKKNTTGQTVWSANFPNAVADEIKADKNNNLYVKSGNLLIKIKADGTQDWQVTQPMSNWLLDSYSNVYYIYDRNLSRMDANTGNIRWSQAYTHIANSPLPYPFPFNMINLNVDKFSNVYAIGQYGNLTHFGIYSNLAVKYSPMWKFAL